MFGEITSEIINKCIAELQTDENRQRLRSFVLEPLVDVLLKRIERHIYTLYLIVFLVAGLLLWLILTLRNHQKIPTF